MTLALGFATRGSAALDGRRPNRSTTASRPSPAAYKAGWVEYRNRLKPIPAAALPGRAAYETSLLVLKAHEDKDNPGAFVASPSMPWGWGELTIDPDNPRSGPYHLVWPRDLYQVATALHAAGDTDGANDALDFAVRQAAARRRLVPAEHPGRRAPEVDRDPDGPGRACRSCSPGSSAAPGRADWRHVRAAADFIVDHGPKTEQERWENQEGYSPATIAAEIAGLICAADIARRNGDTRARRRPTSARRTPGSATSSAGRRRPTAPTRPSRTTCASPRTASRTRARRTRSATPARRRWTSAAWSTSPSSSSSGSASSAPTTRRSSTRCKSSTQQARGGLVLAPLLASTATASAATAKPWRLFDDDTRRTLGRAWPIFAGERGEYELLAGRPATAQLRGDGLGRQRRRDAPRAGLGRPRTHR